jgi:hypothetical protein
VKDSSILCEQVYLVPHMRYASSCGEFVNLGLQPIAKGGEDGLVTLDRYGKCEVHQQAK